MIGVPGPGQTPHDAKLRRERVSTSPTALKRWIAGELARLREHSGRSRAEAAKAVRGSVQNIGHFEVGRRLPKPLELETLLRFYGAADRADFFLALRERAKKGTDWWVRFDSEDALPDYLKLFLGVEAMAAAIESWDAFVIPGLFQTRDYADALIRGAAPKLRKRQRDLRVGLRMGRQAEVLDGENPPRVHAVISEAALRSVVGGAQVLRAQLARLLELAASPNVEIQVLPFASGLHTGVDGSFMLLTFPTDFGAEAGTAYVENLVGVSYYEEASAVASFREAIDRLKLKALGRNESARFVEQVMEDIA